MSEEIVLDLEQEIGELRQSVDHMLNEIDRLWETIADFRSELAMLRNKVDDLDYQVWKLRR